MSFQNTVDLSEYLLFSITSSQDLRLAYLPDHLLSLQDLPIILISHAITLLCDLRDQNQTRDGVPTPLATLSSHADLAESFLRRRQPPVPISPARALKSKIPTSKTVTTARRISSSSESSIKNWKSRRLASKTSKTTKEMSS